MLFRSDYFFAPLVSALPLVKDGKVLALAVGSASRSPLLPDVPTTVEAGVPGSDYNFWVGMLAPKKTPQDIVARLNAEVLKVLQSPEMKERLNTLGAEPWPMQPAQFDAYIKAEIETISKLVKAANIPTN